MSIKDEIHFIICSKLGVSESDSTEVAAQEIYNLILPKKQVSVETIECDMPGEFSRMLSAYLSDGYEVLSCNCGFINSENYDFRKIYQAIVSK